MGYGLSGLAAVLLAGSLIARASWAARFFSIILGAYVATHYVKFSLPNNSELFPVVFAGIWVSASSLMWSVVRDCPNPAKRRFLFSKSFISLSGICYFWADISNAPRAFGSPPYVLADVLAIAAMITIGWSLRDEFIGRLSELSSRGRGMVGNSAFRAGGSVVNKENRNTSNTSGAEYAREVMSNG